LKDAENNIPVEEEKFDKVEDNQVSLRCNLGKFVERLDMQGSKPMHGHQSYLIISAVYKLKFFKQTVTRTCCLISQKITPFLD